MADTSRLRTTLPNARVTPRFAGIATFLRFPLIEMVAADQRPVDWAVYGVPFDGGTTYQSGARFGPRAIRDASQYLKPVHLELGVNIAEIFSLADAGDAPVKPFSCKQTIDAACSFAETIGDPRKTRLLAVGGDHSIAYANIRATWIRRGKPKGGLGLLHFDAHLDTVDSVWDEKWSHASPIIRAVEDGLIDPKRMLSIGVRGPLNSASDLDFAREKGVELLTLDQWRGSEGSKRIDAFIKRLGNDETYLTFDIDCIDPAFAPGTGTPCCGGFTSAEILRVIRGFAGVNIVGADVVEVLPDRDQSGITALLAAHVMHEILSISAVSMNKNSPQRHREHRGRQ